jgi:hypothetical protein
MADRVPTTYTSNKLRGHKIVTLCGKRMQEKLGWSLLRRILQSSQGESCFLLDARWTLWGWVSWLTWALGLGPSHYPYPPSTCSPADRSCSDPPLPPRGTGPTPRYRNKGNSLIFNLASVNSSMGATYTSRPCGGKAWWGRGRTETQNGGGGTWNPRPG